MKKDYIYLRTSTDMQNPENQEEDVKTISEPDAEVVFEQQSAWKDNINNRPKFKKIYDEVKAGNVNTISVWDLDRLYRNRKACVAFVRLCKSKGTEIRSFRQQWLTQFKTVPEPWREIMEEQLIQIFAWMAEEESNKKSERVRLAVRKHKGVTVSYRGNKWGRKNISTQAKSKVLALASEGASVPEIISQVRIKDKNGQMKPIGRSTVYKILAENPIQK